MLDGLEKLLVEFDGNLGADPEAIEAAGEALGIRFPKDFVAFLLATDGGEGTVGETYVMLWRASELPGMNASYEVAEYAPGLLLIGSNGGGEAFAFDTRSVPWPIVQVPFVGMELTYAEPLASSFHDFLKGLTE